MLFDKHEIIIQDQISLVFMHARNKSHADILERVSKYVWQNKAYAKLPRYRKEYFAGVIDTKWRELERGLTSFVVLDGQLILPNSVPTGEWYRVEDGGGRYWAETMTRYDKPYTK